VSIKVTKHFLHSI